VTRKEHLLVCACEEAIEVALALAQRISKGLRFGLDEVQVGQDKTNAERVIQEFADLTALISMLASEGHLPFVGADKFAEMTAAKKAKIEKFLLVSKDHGTLS
jgi:phosphoribosyl-ATP pyrophosphohydrolase